MEQVWSLNFFFMNQKSLYSVYLFPSDTSNNRFIITVVIPQGSFKTKINHSSGLHETITIIVNYSLHGCAVDHWFVRKPKLVLPLSSFRWPRLTSMSSPSDSTRVSFTSISDSWLSPWKLIWKSVDLVMEILIWSLLFCFLLFLSNKSGRSNLHWIWP